MKIKGIIGLAALVLILFTGCSANDGTSSTESTERETDITTSVESTEETQAATGTTHEILRSESKVRKDTTINSTITSQESYQIGTYITLSIYADAEVPGEVFDDLFNLIDYYEYMTSKNIVETELNEINRNAGIAPVNVSDELFDMIRIGLEYSKVSNGLFDLSIGPLVDLWGIGSDHAKLPTETEITNILKSVDYTKIVVDDSTKSVYLSEKGMALDLGAIAKGYIADRLKDMILEKGYESAIINLGGNVLTVGGKPNSDHWNIGVRDPESDAGSTMGVLKLKDNSIVSSGTYERFFIQDNVRYHHILNTETGYPEQNKMLSVSIISDRSVDGDALSTTVFLLGLEKGYAYVETLENIDAVFIMEDHSVYVTSGLKDKFSLMGDGYELKELK
ncbi:MAG: FAD:protein FMN transferase [Firmicutes bacterium]|nr:FAD:protein FMN transferase [Bacillota bacterium]